MTSPQDITKMFKDMLGNLPVDTSPLENAFQKQAALNEKFAQVVFQAAEKSSELSNKWTSETLNKMQDIAKAKAEPADYAKAMTDFASAQAEVAAENIAAFAEIAKKVQMDTVELVMSAGKELQEDTTAAVKKATGDVAAAAKKATKK